MGVKMHARECKKSRLIIETEDQDMIEKVRVFAYQNNLNVEMQFFTEKDNSEEVGREVERNSIPMGRIIPFKRREMASESVKTMREVEKEQIKKAIVQCRGNLTEAAKVLGLGRATLYRKVKSLEIDVLELRTQFVAA